MSDEKCYLNLMEIFFLSKLLAIRLFSVSFEKKRIFLSIDRSVVMNNPLIFDSLLSLKHKATHSQETQIEKKRRVQKNFISYCGVCIVHMFSMKPYE